MKKIFRILAPFLAIAAGILFLFLGIGRIKAQNAYLPVQGEITDIQVEYNTGDDSNDYHVFVKYTAEGMEYETELGEYDVSMDIGDEVELKYNPENPGEIVTAGVFPTIIMFVLAVAGILGGIFAFLKRLGGR